MSKTIRTCSAEIFGNAVKQITEHKVSPASLPFVTIIKYLDTKRDQDFPDINVEQCQELLELIHTEYLSNRKGKQPTAVLNIYNKILELIDILNTCQDSTFTICIDGQTYTKQRMENKMFNTHYNCLVKSSNSTTTEFITQINDIVINRLEPIDLSVLQVIAFINTYNTNSDNKKKFMAYYEYINQSTNEDEYYDTDQLMNQVTQSAKEINYLFRTVPEYNLDSFSLENIDIHTLYLGILEQCKNLALQQFDIVPAAQTAFRDYIPLVIFKSWQIYNYFRDHKDFKIIKCVLFNHYVPICCVSTVVPDDLIIQQMDSDMHLRHNSKFIHRLVYTSDTTVLTGDVVHHINSNEFDNRRENLITMYENVPPENGVMQAVKKHTNLHRIMQTNHVQMFYKNCYDIRMFEESDSFYKKLIKDITNVKKFNFEYQSSMVMKVDQDLFALYNFIKDSPRYYKEIEAQIIPK